MCQMHSGQVHRIGKRVKNSTFITFTNVKMEWLGANAKQWHSSNIINPTSISLAHQFSQTLLSLKLEKRATSTKDT